MCCALINTATGLVENLIMADESDPVEASYLLEANPPAWVTIGTPWDGDFVDSRRPQAAPVPSPPLETL